MGAVPRHLYGNHCGGLEEWKHHHPCVDVDTHPHPDEHTNPYSDSYANQHAYAYSDADRFDTGTR